MPHICFTAPKPDRHLSELIPNDPLREIEIHAQEIFEPKSKTQNDNRLIPNDPLRSIEIYADEIFGTSKRK